jgi:ERCC4-related helicase
VIASNLPAVRTRTLTGLDKVELWTEQSIWDAVLNGYRVIVSTHAVLADALSHGFVKMSRLALIIFDEGMSTIWASLKGRMALIGKL